HEGDPEGSRVPRAADPALYGVEAGGGRSVSSRAREGARCGAWRPGVSPSVSAPEGTGSWEAGCRRAVWGIAEAAAGGGEGWRRGQQAAAGVPARAPEGRPAEAAGPGVEGGAGRYRHRDLAVCGVGGAAA